MKFLFGLVLTAFVWINGLYIGLLLENKTDVKHSTRNDSVIEKVNVSVPFFEMVSSSCPSNIAVAWDGGRFGNKFFEYLAARLTAEVLRNEIYITREFADVYDQYFNGRKTRIIDWNYLHYQCGIEESNCTKLFVNYLPELKPLSRETFKCIKFEGRVD